MAGWGGCVGVGPSVFECAGQLMVVVLIVVIVVVVDVVVLIVVHVFLQHLIVVAQLEA